MKQVVLCSLAVVASGTALRASAASLNYTHTTNIYLSSPAVNVVIQAGAVAEALTVDATSVAVTLSTGETFTLTSPQSVSSSTTGSGGTLSRTCSSGTETDAITQTTGSETYTLTPTGWACTVNQAPHGTAAINQARQQWWAEYERQLNSSSAQSSSNSFTATSVSSPTTSTSPSVAPATSVISFGETEQAKNPVAAPVPLLTPRQLLISFVAKRLEERLKQRGISSTSPVYQRLLRRLKRWLDPFSSNAVGGPVGGHE